MSWGDMPIFAADVLVVQFFAGGKPIGAGSKRGFVVTDKAGRPVRRRFPNGKLGPFIVNIVDDTGEPGKEWRNAVKAAARMEYGRKRPPVACAVECEVLFVYPRPQGHYRANGQLKPGADRHHVTRPDSTKLWRSVEDALSGVVWADDGQVVRQTVRKRWARSADEPAGVYVQVVAL